MVSKLHFKKSTIVLSLLVLFTLSSVGSAFVQASSLTQSVAAQPSAIACPAADASLVTEYAIPTENSDPYGITAGPDGALWFAEGAGQKIGRVTTDGQFTEYPFPVAHSDQHFLAAGPDGAVWFTD